MIDTIATELAPGAIGPYSQAAVGGQLLFVSGQLPVDPVSGTMPERAGAQADRCLSNVRAVLAAAGFDPADVVKTTVFLTDLDDFSDVNEVYTRHFSAPFPARSCVQVARLPKGAQVEVEVIAYRTHG